MTETVSNSLSEAEIETAKWREKVGRIGNAIAAAQAVVNSSERRRAQHALAAATGDAAATAAMKKIHAEDDGAKRQLADLQLALTSARTALANAEQIEAGTRKKLNKETAQAEMRKRIIDAANIDAALVHLAQCIDSWTRRGDTIRGHYDELFGGATHISTTNNAFGPARLLAALPPIFGKLFPTVSRGEHRPLAISEADFWGLAEEKKKTS